MAPSLRGKRGMRGERGKEKEGGRWDGERVCNQAARIRGKNGRRGRMDKKTLVCLAVQARPCVLGAR